jgi:HTH-type transcriptional regulator/antitoxin HigA
MNIRPIRTEEDYEAACRRIDEVFQAEPGTQADDELEILVTLVNDYEEKRFPIETPDPIDAIGIQMENLGVSRKDLMNHLGKSSGRISDMLNRRRALTLADIRSLSRFLHIPIAVLSREYQLEQPVARQAQGFGKEASPP